MENIVYGMIQLKLQNTMSGMIYLKIFEHCALNDKIQKQENH